ncbi:hypothetical protein GCM10022631_22220 [Deinococcus rubellus]|uniref:Uncharacterized protein n=1 Tax=Deinococcus rubellus TaxID=1889240 RepID=A0ABY5YKI5_9DEIO|nr:hypothetical protein [Deinococcus rubellus]UWX64283.1 hypothetical protein N0D28_00990 [Deinococcus rubellus]
MKVIEEAQQAYEDAKALAIQARAGHEKLIANRDRLEGECTSAQVEWNKAKSDKAMQRMIELRGQLNSTRELLAEEILPLSEAEAYESTMLASFHHAEATQQAVDLAVQLGKQHEYFREDFNTLQRQMIETLGKLHLTAKGMASMHNSQHALAKDVGLTVEQLQRRVEAQGFDANPLKLVLYHNNVMGLDPTIERSFKFPNAVDGSGMAQYVKETLIAGVMKPHLDQQRSLYEQERQSMRRYQSGQVQHATAESEREEERELKRRTKAADLREAQATREAEAYEAREYGAVVRPQALQQSITVILNEDEQ